jgi:hypothetical protein
MRSACHQVHSECLLLEGVCKVEQLAERAHRSGSRRSVTGAKHAKQGLEKPTGG